MAESTERKTIPLAEVPARIPGLTYSRAWQIATNGQLDTTRVGARIFVTEESIERFRAAQAAGDR